MGLYRLGDVFGIEELPETKISYRKITENSYWVDDSSSTYYSQWVELEGIVQKNGPVRSI